MEIDNQFPERVRKVSENYFLNIYFFNLDISLTIHDLNLKVFIHIDNIFFERTVSQIFDIGSCFFSHKI